MLILVSISETSINTILVGYETDNDGMADTWDQIYCNLTKTRTADTD
jgi:hypothetical protein